MLQSRTTKQFDKEFAGLKRLGYDMEQILEIMGMLVNEEPLPEACAEHFLREEYAGKIECHIEDDWLLVYRIDAKNRKIVFERTGTHSDLFLHDD